MESGSTSGKKLLDTLDTAELAGVSSLMQKEFVAVSSGVGWIKCPVSLHSAPADMGLSGTLVGRASGRFR